LYYAKARYYDAEIGRFVSEDSYRGEKNNSVSLNLYAYVKNNPILNVDWSGNAAVAAVIAATVTAETLIEVIIGGTTVIVTVRYFFSKEGQRKFKNAVKVICNEVAYTAKKFIKKFKSLFTTEYKLSDNIPTLKPVADAIPKPKDEINNKTEKEKTKGDSKVRDKNGKVIDKSKVPKPRENNNKVTGKMGSLDKKGEPNSSTELYNKNGKLIQRRYYDKNGNVEFDIDFSHGGNHVFPHIHNWR
jgi:uncharacterized protein RhaS with RHS repeats